jgi:hypothetical protein
MNHKKVLVLGCGPAGLMVAHALTKAGVTFEIMAPFAKPSYISGAQYLHSYVPGLGLRGREEKLAYVRIGTEEGYARKIYGDAIPPSATSWSRFPDAVEAWPLRAAYDALWDRYHSHIIEERISWGLLLDLLPLYGAVFSTAPLTELVPRGLLHIFQYQDVWITPGDFQDEATPYNTIVYNGTVDDSWYRRSNIFGHTSIEFPAEPNDVTLGEVKRIRKPLAYTGPDPIPQIYKFGRYGTWQKKVLVDDAYKGAMAILFSSRPPSQSGTM